MDNPNTDVLITNIELKQYDNTNQYKITGNTNSGEKKFSFYSTKKDGDETSAYQQFKSMGLQVGSTVNITYKEEQKEYQGKPYTARTVIWFRETNTPASTLLSTTPAGKPHQEANRGQSGESSDAFSRRLGIQGHINGLLGNPNLIKGFPVDVADIEKIVGVAVKVEDEAEKQLSSSSRAAFDRGYAKAQAKEEYVNDMDDSEYQSLADSIPF